MKNALPFDCFKQIQYKAFKDVKEKHMTPRKLSNKEMFELPDNWKGNGKTGWENPKVDITQYNPSIMAVWEVCQDDYTEWKNAGRLCQKYQDRFYIA